MTKKKILEYISNSLKGFLISAIKIFFYGIIALVPILIILWLFSLFGDLKEILELILEKVSPGIEIPGWIAGIILFLIIIGIGALAPFVTKKLYFWIGKLTKNLLRRKIKEQYYGTVIFEFRKEIWVPGIITGYIKGSEFLKGGRLLKIFCPTTPTPVTGQLFIVQEKKVIRINLTLNEVINTYTSGGILAPQRIPELVAELEKREAILEASKEKI